MTAKGSLLAILLLIASNCNIQAFHAVCFASRARTAVRASLVEDNDPIMKSANRRVLLASAIVMGNAIALSPKDVQAVGAPKATSLSEEYRQGTAALSDEGTDAPVPREAYKKLDSGLVFADLISGSGPEIAEPGSRVNTQWVLRRSDGYFLDSSRNNDGVPFIFTVGDGKAVQGLDEGIRGMKVGGVRRLLIPPSLGYVQGVNDGLPGPIPTGFGPRQQTRRVQKLRKDVPGEYLYMEVQLTRLR